MTPPATRPPVPHLRLVHSTGGAQTRRRCGPHSSITITADPNTSSRWAAICSTTCACGTLIDAPTIGQLRTAWAAHLIDTAADRGMPPPAQTD